MDFPCRGHAETADGCACQLRCAPPGCANAIKVCRSLPECTHVSLNGQTRRGSVWATLKRARPPADWLTPQATSAALSDKPALRLEQTCGARARPAPWAAWRNLSTLSVAEGAAREPLCGTLGAASASGALLTRLGNATVGLLALTHTQRDSNPQPGWSSGCITSSRS
jgi:hypothetical protein